MSEKAQMVDSVGAVDFDNCNKNAYLVKKKLNALNDTMKKMVSRVSNIGTAFESVARCYVDITGVAVTRRGYGEIPVSPKSRVELNNAAKLFATEMQNMLEANTIKEYQVNVYSRILDRMHPLRTLSKGAIEAGRKTKDALKKYENKKRIVTNKKKKYTNKHKPISDSKLFEKQVKECDAAHEKWSNMLKLFYEKYAELMTAVEKTTGDTMDQFLDINYQMLQSIIASLCGFTLNAAQMCPTTSNVLTSAIYNSMSVAAASQDFPRTAVSRADRPTLQSERTELNSPRRPTASEMHWNIARSPDTQSPSGEDPYALTRHAASPEPSESIIVSSLAESVPSPVPKLDLPPAADVTAAPPGNGWWGNAESYAEATPQEGKKL